MTDRENPQEASELVQDMRGMPEVERWQWGREEEEEEIVMPVADGTWRPPA